MTDFDALHKQLGGATAEYIRERYPDGLPVNFAPVRFVAQFPEISEGKTYFRHPTLWERFSLAMKPVWLAAPPLISDLLFYVVRSGLDYEAADEAAFNKVVYAWAVLTGQPTWGILDAGGPGSEAHYEAIRAHDDVEAIKAAAAARRPCQLPAGASGPWG